MIDCPRCDGTGRITPEDGTRLLAGRAGDRLRLRAARGGAEPEGLRWEVDGRAVEARTVLEPQRIVQHQLQPGQ